MALSLAECIDTLVAVQTDDALTSMFHNAGGGLRAHLEQDEARRQQAQQVDAKAAAGRLRLSSPPRLPTFAPIANRWSVHVAIMQNCWIWTKALQKD